MTDIGGEEVLPGFCMGLKKIHDPEHELEPVPGKGGMAVLDRVHAGIVT
jgi:hypothetical protein